MKPASVGLVLCLALPLVNSAALGADAARGKRLAEQRCEACHLIGRGPQNARVVAEAPPFVAIGRKFNFDADMLVYALTGPHAKMNFSLRGREADDVAAYIATLAR